MILTFWCGIAPAEFDKDAKKKIDLTDIIGLWKVVATAPGIDRNRRKADQQWEFKKDGTYILTAKDHRVSSTTFSTKAKFLVENNVIKIERAGRPGKYILYRVYDKKGPELILQGGLEGFYFLKK